MTTVIVGMIVALVLALAVVALVAVPARREGRDLLTPQGEQLVQTARERTTEAASAAREKTVEVAGAARERVRGSNPDASPDAEAEPAAEAAPEAEIDLREERARTVD